MAILPVGISGEEAGYQIERSLRFNSADTAYLNRTPASAGNRKTWTWSGWVKLGSNFDTRRMLFGGGQAGGGTYPNTYIEITDGNVLGIDQVAASTYSTVMRVRTTAVLRDPSSWYHLLVAVDTTQATDTNRVKMYINGVQQTSFSSTTYPSLDLDTGVNTTTSNKIGVYPEDGVATLYFNGYLTEINFIDGSALDPTSFGEYNEDTGVWQPKAYTGSYGTNGFYLNFSDNATTTTLGDDLSGNGNDWTTNNFSVTAGAGNDSLVDTPTPYGTDTGVGGEVRGNYATWNPLRNDQNAVLSNGNLDLSTAGSTSRTGTYTTIGVASGKWYWEITAGSLSTDGYNIGIASASKGATSALGSDTQSYIYLSSGDKRTNATTAAYGATYTAADVIGVALDLDAGTLVFYKNNASQGTAYSSIPSNTWFPVVADDATGSTTGSSFIANFGQRPFAYTAPSGFKALCTQNLPEPTIVDGGEYFNTVLYTGTGSSQSITGVGFQPDFVWIKERNAAADHGLYDAVRSVQNQLESNTTTAETAEATGLTAFGSDGFTVGALAQLNTSADTYVAWNWKANGAGVSNTAGTITSTVSANTDSGFSIVTWTGGAGTVGHGLGVAPKMVIAKNRTTAQDWYVWFTGFTSSQYLVLNGTNAIGTSGSLWNSTLPSSTVIGLDLGGTNDIVAYCFAAKESYSSAFSFTGNGSADGSFVFLGFRPAWVLIKRTDTTSNWTILDFQREGYNVDNDPLYPNLANAEGTTDLADLLSNGFKLRTTDASVNASGGTYIGFAVAQNPFKYSLGR